MVGLALGMVWAAWGSADLPTALEERTLSSDDRSLTDEASVGHDRDKMALSLAETGWRLIAKGRSERAAKAFELASALVPDQASFLVGLGFSQRLLGRDDLAVATLERAITLDPRAVKARRLLGTMYEQRGEMEAAVRHYEGAFRQDPSDETLRARLFTARRQSQAEARFDRLFSAHFVVTYPGSTGRGIANDIADRLEAAYHEVGQRLSYFPTAPITVVLYPDWQFQKVTSSPKWVRGLFDGRIHLSIEELAGDLTARQAALRHEYTHAVVHRLSGGHAPTWLTEGLALYFEGGDAVRHREDLRRQARTRLPLTSLHGSFLTLEARSARLAYAESYGATRALVQRHGLTGVRRLLETLAVVPDLATAFETVLPERYSDFQAAWARMAAGTRF